VIFFVFVLSQTENDTGNKPHLKAFFQKEYTYKFESTEQISFQLKPK